MGKPNLCGQEIRRHDIGSLLHEEVVKIAKRLGRNEILLDIFEVNDASKGFYNSFGIDPVYTI
ncbi:hypothetical protein GCM10023116_28340 [Kistimonas scapharcae]|uniref:N-acetyltransferase domain-containing protein n=1 Tax=Kistimonas scapharcae TaxID=1036133 RepID=A0ABP8V416_9GAMM